MISQLRVCEYRRQRLKRLDYQGLIVESLMSISNGIDVIDENANHPQDARFAVHETWSTQVSETRSRYDFELCVTFLAL